ncbi:MAG: AraC family ligand binding domain-containing protein, partial [Gorillibacterium sp.]|nr:AraC family ligand binding domain-containing protein [Gorillibacterium sp.]
MYDKEEVIELMYPIHKTFPDSEGVPFHFVYRDTKSPQNELPDHWHDRSEIVFVQSGEGIFFINGMFLSMRPGDVFLLPADTIHRAIPDSVNPVTSSVLFISPSLLAEPILGDTFTLSMVFDRARTTQTYRIPLDEPLRCTVQAVIHNIQAEFDHKQSGYYFSVKLHIQRLLLDLYRRGSLSPDYETATNGS